MSEISLRSPDDDLIPLLLTATNEMLDPLVAYITAKGEGRISSELEITGIYKGNHPNHHWYAKEIAAEIQKFGGNTVANIFRGGQGVLYHEVVCDVAKQMKVNFNDTQSAGEIEQAILLKVLENSWGKMDKKQREELLTTVGIDHSKGLPSAFPIVALQAAIRLGGFTAYRVAVIVANAVAKAILKRGLSLAANRALTQSLAIIAGPIGLAIMAIWTALDLAGPAYRVTIPCVIQVALIRQLQNISICPNGHENAKGAKFCSQCGKPLKSKKS